MTRIALIAATALMIAPMAQATGFSIDLPNLDFPPEPDVTVTRACTDLNVTSATCMVQE